jgi:hypothetical protein
MKLVSYMLGGRSGESSGSDSYAVLLQLASELKQKKV